jgi:hypothetical protein
MNGYTTSAPTLFVGDVVSVDKGVFTHVGVVLQYGILENRPGFRERMVPLAVFCDGHPYTVKRTNANAALVMARATKILSKPREYNALTQNCEHTVNEVLAGEANSPQLAGWALLGGFAALIFALSR